MWASASPRGRKFVVGWEVVASSLSVCIPEPDAITRQHSTNTNTHHATENNWVEVNIKMYLLWHLIQHSPTVHPFFSFFSLVSLLLLVHNSGLQPRIIIQCNYVKKFYFYPEQPVMPSPLITCISLHLITLFTSSENRPLLQIYYSEGMTSQPTDSLAKNNCESFNLWSYLNVDYSASHCLPLKDFVSHIVLTYVQIWINVWTPKSHWNRTEIEELEYSGTLYSSFRLWRKKTKCFAQIWRVERCYLTETFY